jgi:hypothetical protein
MAIQISGTTIINNTKELDTGLKSVYPTVEVSNSDGSVVNRTFRVLEDTNVVKTITLPANPEVGNEVCVMLQGEFLENVVARNGQKIMGIDEDITLDIRNAGVTFVYTGTDLGWRIY